MKLTYFQLAPHLEKNLVPVYLVSGDEPLLKQDSMNMLRKAAKKAGFTERVKLPNGTDFEWSQLYTHLHTSSLLAEKKILELDFSESLPNKDTAKILQEYAATQHQTNFLMINLSKLDVKVAKAAWYKALEAKGVAVTIWPLPAEQFPQWIINRAKRYQLQISRSAANLLSELVEGNLAAASQAIEKIYLLRTNQSIDENIIKEVIAKEGRYSIFDLLDTLLNGQSQRALQILESLKEEGTEPTLIVWGIARELRLLAELSQTLQENKMSKENLFRHYRIYARRETAFRYFLTHHSHQECLQLLMHMAAIDRLIKGAIVGQVWHALEIFCLRL